MSGSLFLHPVRPASTILHHRLCGGAVTDLKTQGQASKTFPMSIFITDFFHDEK